MRYDKSACIPHGHKGRDIKKKTFEVKHEGYYVFDDSKKKYFFLIRQIAYI